MIKFTYKAVEKLKSMQAALPAEEVNKRLRMFVSKGGCSGYEYGMSFDEKQTGDEAQTSCEIEYFIDPESLAQLDGSVVDFDDGLQGKGFEIKNPNAKNTCGCGKSFN